MDWNELINTKNFIVGKKIYNESLYSMPVAVEYCVPEVFLTSIYRYLGYPKLAEAGANKKGNILDRKLRDFIKKSRKPDGAVLEAEQFEKVIKSIIACPKLSPTSKRGMSLSPLIPEIAQVANVARPGNSNPFNPSSIIENMICIGNPENAENKFYQFFLKLSIGENEGNFPKWLSQEFKSWLGNDFEEWEYNENRKGKNKLLLEDNELKLNWINDTNTIKNFPAKQYCKDLDALLDVKDLMTRRQWTNLIETNLRLATASHILWICKIQFNLWRILQDALKLGNDHNENSLKNVLFDSQGDYLRIGQPVRRIVDDVISKYLLARIGINVVLNALEEKNILLPNRLSCVNDIHKLYLLVKDNREIIHQDIFYYYNKLKEKFLSAISCKKSIGKNMREFFKHCLEQRSSVLPIYKGYDQGFYSSKKTRAFELELGPVSVLSATHCTLYNTLGSKSVHRLTEYFKNYGVEIDKIEKKENSLSRQLAHLGLVLDNPDAESGMLLNKPF